MLIYYMLNFNFVQISKTNILFLIFFIALLYSASIAGMNNTCKNLETSLEVNSGVYKKCLLEDPGKKFSRDELEKCKKNSLQELERVSYIFKNICKKN